MKQQFLGAAAAAVLLSVPVAHAAPMLAFQVDGGAILFCADQDLPGVGPTGCDKNPAVGAVTFLDPIGPFTINVTTGVSKALVSGNPLLGLNTIEITGAPGAHELVVAFSDNGFNAQGQFFGDFAGTLTGAGATVEADAYYSTNNLLFAQTSPIVSLGPFNPSIFAESFVDGVAPTGPYSVSQFITLNTSGTVQTTLTAGFVINVPEPTTLALLGLGLGLFGFMMRRRQESS